MINVTMKEHTINSQEVAAITNKRHTELLRDIRKYIEYLNLPTERKIASSDFFQESSYFDPTGRTLPCYLITRKGCEMIANKMTGQKGTLFTAAYINKFHEMEQGKHLPQPKPQYVDIPNNEKAQLAIQSIKDHLTSIGMVIGLANKYNDLESYTGYNVAIKHLAADLVVRCYNFDKIEVALSDKPGNS